jgi:hypothetical protein
VAWGRVRTKMRYKERRSRKEWRKGLIARITRLDPLGEADGPRDEMSKPDLPCLLCANSLRRGAN